jgi:hypothetical protein
VPTDTFRCGTSGMVVVSWLAVSFVLARSEGTALSLCFVGALAEANMKYGLLVKNVLR